MVSNHIISGHIMSYDQTTRRPDDQTTKRFVCSFSCFVFHGFRVTSSALSQKIKSRRWDRNVHNIICIHTSQYQTPDTRYVRMSSSSFYFFFGASDRTTSLSWYSSALAFLQRAPKNACRGSGICAESSDKIAPPPAL